MRAHIMPCAVVNRFRDGVGFVLPVILALCFFPTLVAYAADSFVSEVVDTEVYLSHRNQLAVALDGNGVFHAVNHDMAVVDYYTNASGHWVRENLKLQSLTLFGDPDIDLTPDGAAWVIWPDPDEGLVYRTNPGGTWIGGPIQAGVPSTAHCSIASMPGGTPNVVFTHGPTAALCWAIMILDTWIIEPIYDAHEVESAFITLDDQMRPHVIFTRLPGKDVLYANRHTGNWTVREVSNAGDLRAQDILVDDFGRIHTLINDETTNTLRWAVSANDLWSTMNTIVIDDAMYGHGLALVDGTWPCVVYQRGFTTPYQTYAMIYDGNNWSQYWIEDDEKDQYQTSPRVIVDSQNVMHAFYLNSGGTVHADNKNGFWRRQWIGGYSDPGLDAELELDGAGEPVAGYRIRSNGGAVYAYKEQGEWVREIASYQKDDAVNGISLAMNTYDDPVLALTKDSGLYYTTRNAGIWSELQVVNSLSPHSPSIAVDWSNDAGIAYVQGTTLRLALEEFSGWTNETVGYQPFDAFEPAIAFDDALIPHIAFGDEDRDELRYAARYGGGWSLSTVGEISPFLYDYPRTALFLDPGDHQAYVCYRGRYSFVYQTGMDFTWTGTVPEPYPQMELGTAIVLDAADRPCIVADDTATDELYFMVQTDLGWSWSSVDVVTTSEPNSFDLAIGANHQPYVVYPGEDLDGNGVLWLATRTELPDLKVGDSQISFSRDNAVLGEYMTISPWDLVNDGGVASGSFNTYYLITDDPSFQVFNANLRSFNTSNLPEYSSTHRSSVPITIPGGLANGPHYLGIYPDWPDGVSELDETNNTWFAPIDIYAPIWSDGTNGALADPGNIQSVAWGDFDNDGDQDLYRTLFRNPNQLCRNEGGGVFVDATPTVLADAGDAAGTCWVDIDNDSDLDLFLANLGTGDNELFRNDGGGDFSKITPYAIGEPGVSTYAGCWADYDLDGLVDLYLARTNRPNALFRNLGDGEFIEVTPPELADSDPTIRSANWVDYDNDGDPDLYLVKLGESNQLLRNDGGGNFTNIATWPMNSSENDISCAWGDYDNDGDQDVYLVRIGLPDLLLYNSGDGRHFWSAGAGSPADDGSGQSASWGDYDDDGDLDLYVARGSDEGRLYRNEGAGVWQDAAPREVDGGFSATELAWADSDGDGDLDLLVSGLRSKLLRNDFSPSNHWLEFDLQGGYSNYSAIGARVTVITGSLRQHRQIQTSVGGHSQDALIAHFGLGASSVADSVIIHWPSRMVQVLTSVAADQRLTVVESAQDWVDVTVSPLDTLSTATGVAWVDHDADGDLDLYLACNSIPNVLMDNVGAGFLSEISAPPINPATADRAVTWGDYDNDGDPDLYLALLTGPNLLMRNEGGGLFVDVTTAPLDVGGYTPDAEWVDTDNDGNLDLYVVNRDGANFLFHNEGDGSFTDVTSGPLGDASIGNDSVWCDYDGDGDQDVYLTNYEAPNRLLRNEGNDVFLDVTSGDLGFVGTWSVAVWGDYDNDRDFDLYLTLTGNANYLFRNDGGDSFHPQQHAPVNDPDGCRGLIWGDYDNDGDLDLFQARFGLSNQLLRNDGASNFTVVEDPAFQQASPERGNGAVFGDYDADGDLDLFVTGAHSNSKLVRNFAAGENHWLHVRLTGTVSNASAIGAHARIVAGGQSQIRQVGGDTGYGSQSSLDLEFGLGAETTVDSLIIRWPSGVTQTMVQVAADQLLEVREVEWSDITSAELGITWVTQGAAWGDYDGDGFDDLFVGANYRPNYLLHNDQYGGFTDATPVSWTEQDLTTRPTWADYDNDGDLDLYVTNQDDGMLFPGIDNILYRNDGAGVFTDVSSPAVEWGMIGLATDSGWFECDADGDVDLAMLSGYRANRVARNDGGDAFTEIACGDLAIESNYDDFAMGDYDDDGDLDAYLLMYSGYNPLLRNDGNGVFVDVTAGDLLNVESGMACAWGDYDNDGDLDLYITRWYLDNLLMRNDGGGVFTEATPPELAINLGSYGFTWGDFDNNGHLDLYVPGWNTTENHYLLNHGGGVFTDESDGVLITHDDSYGANCTDIDHDGDLDIYVFGVGANQMLRNELANDNHWLQVDLIGTVSNRSAIGARVWLVGDGFRMMREISDDTGGLAEGSRTLEFGMGEADFADSLIIRWPSGILQVGVGVVADQRITATEQGVITGVDLPPTTKGRFALYPAVPNPFNPSTTIRYELPESLPVSLRIYSVSGRLMKVLRSGGVEAQGSHSVIWRGEDDGGSRVASGVYFYRLEAGPHQAVGRMTLLK